MSRHEPIEKMRQVLHCCDACGQPIDEWEKVLEVDGVQAVINAVVYAGKAARLTRGSMILLRMLMIRGRVSNEAFMIASNSDAEKSTSNAYVCYLRKALRELDAPLVVRTVYGWGYELRRQDGTAATTLGRATDALNDIADDIRRDDPLGLKSHMGRRGAQ